MNLAQGIDFNSLMEPVALRLLGEPAQKHGHEWRYGNRGSLSIDLAKGHWFDHEANTGGGVFDLIKRLGHEQPAAWLRREGLLTTPQVVGRPRPRIIVKTYDYCDENGELLYQVCRFEPKDFRPRRPDGKFTLEGVRRVLYRLPELLKAVADGRLVYV
jgi:putative DNA primase/helicase